MAAEPTTPAAYLRSLPADRREAVEAIRATIDANIDPTFEAGIQYGMLAWYVPHSVYPDGYHCDPEQPVPFASVASQKSHIGLYLFCVYTDPAEKERFVREWKASGKRLDMGASCVRVKKLEDVPLDVLGRAFRRITAKKFLKAYEAALAGGAERRAKKKATSKKKAAGKKKSAKKTARRTTAAKAPKRATMKALSKKAAKRTAKKGAKRVSRRA